MTTFLKFLNRSTPVLLTFFVSCLLIGGASVWVLWGAQGLFGQIFENHTVIRMLIYYAIIGHITIVAMSLSFHRYHTHQGVKLNSTVDFLMQIWLWAFTSMAKREWVSVHIYHHATSDTPKDPHSPVQKGFWHVFLFGAIDYGYAKYWPEVLAIANQIPEKPYEKFIRDNVFLAPVILASASFILFGPVYGMFLVFLNFSTALLFAVGGVNTIAHWIGYRNYETSDNSRNIGFLFPLNFIICGELDHNNHHRYPKSASFRHQWFEFDIGYFYLKWMRRFGLAEIQYAIRPKPVLGRLISGEKASAL